MFTNLFLHYSTLQSAVNRSPRGSNLKSQWRWTGVKFSPSRKLTSGSRATNVPELALSSRHSVTRFGRFTGFCNSWSHVPTRTAAGSPCPTSKGLWLILEISQRTVILMPYITSLHADLGTKSAYFTADLKSLRRILHGSVHTSVAWSPV